MDNITTADVISKIESDGFIYALRFEPGVYRGLYALTDSQLSILQYIRFNNKCTMETAKVIYSTSFGLFQIMGFNLYALDSQLGSIGYYINNETLQRQIFQKFLEKHSINFDIDTLIHDDFSRKKFALTYNGAESYGDLILKAYNELQKV